MPEINDFFPYQSYRPNQQVMLETAASVAEKNGILMIDAPTGCGKSSIISALLARANGRKIIVAVRTISQLQIFIRELELIRKKKWPSLKFTYLIGKGNMCPLGGYGDTYRKCEAVKAFSTNLMQQRAEHGSFEPWKDRVIIDQLSKQDHEHPLLCPYFIRSRMFVQSEEGGKRMVPSNDVRKKAEIVQKEGVLPNNLQEFAGAVCPYDLMLTAARGADVLICNYHHLFDDDIREQLYVNLGCEEGNVILLLDEAHNLGDVVQSVENIRLREEDINEAASELAALRGKVRGSDAIRHVLPRIAQFMEGIKRSTETEDWFDPDIFNRNLIRGSLYTSPASMMDDIAAIQEHIHEMTIASGDFHETSIERLCEFMTRLYRSYTNPAYLTVYTKNMDEVTLEVRNIDPSGRLQELASKHAGVFLISGTLSPTSAYKKFYFGDMPVETLSLPNSFPKENRMVIAVDNITTAYSLRQNENNTKNIVDSILAFSHLKGNVAVYFPSYQLQTKYANLCSHRIRSKIVYIEPRESSVANEALQEFISLPSKHKSGILFAISGGKWSEGLDYRGDQLTAAMVIGLPLAPFTPVRRLVNSYFKRKFGDEGEFIAYTLPAINKSMQALGRVLRTETDKGVLILGDERFTTPEILRGVSPWMQLEMKRVKAETLPDVLASWVK